MIPTKTGFLSFESYPQCPSSSKWIPFIFRLCSIELSSKFCTTVVDQICVAIFIQVCTRMPSWLHLFDATVTEYRCCISIRTRLFLFWIFWSIPILSFFPHLFAKEKVTSKISKHITNRDAYYCFTQVHVINMTANKHQFQRQTSHTSRKVFCPQTTE